MFPGKRDFLCQCFPLSVFFFQLLVLKAVFCMRNLQLIEFIPSEVSNAFFFLLYQFRDSFQKCGRPWYVEDEKLSLTQGVKSHTFWTNYWFLHSMTCQIIDASRHNLKQRVVVQFGERETWPCKTSRVGCGKLKLSHPSQSGESHPEVPH